MLAIESLSRDLNNLLQPLLVSAQLVAEITPPSRHILTIPSGERPGYRASLAQDGRSIENCRKHIQQLSTKLDEIDSACLSLEDTIYASVAPFNAMPTEIIEHIIHFAITTPKQAGRIVQLSLVCKLWNTLVFGMSELFVAPDWESWPDTFIAKWLSLSASRAITCEIPPSLVAFKSLVTSLPLLGSRITTLSIDVGNVDLGLFASLFDNYQALARLHSLTITGFYPQIDFSSASLPELDTLYTTESRVAIPTLPTLQNFGCRMYELEDFLSLLNVIGLCHSLQHVTLFISSLFVVNPMPTGKSWSTPDITHRSLTSLRFQGYSSGDTEFIRPYLRALGNFHLKGLELFDLGIATCKSILTELVSRASITCPLNDLSFDITRTQI
ncbi:hypothetical protein DL93DRAFT_2083660 [Clavulina sp. PMI_390]|nr:hypothetical protein DL93DRAFT_2083660 [Clavulina sp. PMI_390]